MLKTDFNDYFDRMFETCNQGRFENWFTDLASYVWGTDFELIKAGGVKGDKKSDGRRLSQEIVYQCYAPESPATFAKNAVTKIHDSFPEVLSFWPNLKEWVLIHNNRDGITTSVSDTLEDLRLKFPNIKISTATRPFLKSELHDKLSMLQMLDLYPGARLNFKEISLDHIRPLIKRIIKEKKSSFDSADFGEIPNEAKLNFNNFSPDAIFDIKRARPNIGIVDRYLDGFSKPDRTSNIQIALRDKYAELKDFQHEADEILGRLISYVREQDEPTQNAAAYVIIAYFFDACDIFENAPKDLTC